MNISGIKLYNASDIASVTWLHDNDAKSLYNALKKNGLYVVSIKDLDRVLRLEEATMDDGR